MRLGEAAFYLRNIDFLENCILYKGMAVKKERLQWVDNMRGLAVVLVLLAHAPDNNVIEKTLLSLYVIPAFFCCQVI